MSDTLARRWTAAMRAGDWDAAWAIEAAVLAGRDPATRDDPQQPYHQRWVWDGRSMDGRHVLVRCYHGLGDALQFARFLPVLAARAASVTVEATPALHPLLATLDADIALAPFDAEHPLPASECDVEMGELAFALRRAPDETGMPYLRAPRPAAVLPPGTVGLCHTVGNWDKERSFDAELLRPLVAGRAAVTLAAEPSHLPVLNPTGCSLDMAATASLVAGVSLVVTVDTMIAHLAGALGRPVWLLLKAEPDWRWNPASRCSRWYPRTRLYVQREAGDWTSLLEQVAQDLDRRAIG